MKRDYTPTTWTTATNKCNVPNRGGDRLGPLPKHTRRYVNPPSPSHLQRSEAGLTGRLLSKSAVGARVFGSRVELGGKQGDSRPDRELLDAAGLCSHLLAPGSVHMFLAEHRRRLFPDGVTADRSG